MFMWLRCPNTSCGPLFLCGSLRNTAYVIKLMCVSSLQKKIIFTLINQFQPNLTGVEVCKTLYEMFWVVSFISLKQLFAPKWVRPFWRSH